MTKYILRGILQLGRSLSTWGLSLNGNPHIFVMKRPKETKQTDVKEVVLDNIDIIRAATNDPELSKYSVTLGDREFPVVDLPYDSYIRFLALLQPLLKAFASQVTGNTIDTEGLTVKAIIDYCADALPELACITCEQTDPTITIDEIKKLGKTPFKLAAVVFKQIEVNNMIQDITDFFVQILPLMNKK